MRKETNRQTSEKNRSNGLVVTLHFKPADGGIQEYVHQMALHMHLAGENIVVLAPEMKDDAGFDSDCGYKVIRFSRNLRSKGRLLRIICRTARDMDADYLLCTHWKSGLGLNTMVASIISGIPYFIIAYGSEVTRILRSPFKAWIRRMIYKSASRIYCISSYTRDKIKELGVADKKLRIVPCGIDMQFVDKWRKDHSNWAPESSRKLNLEKRKVIFTLARLEQRKGIDNVIEALPLIAREVPDFIYIVGGEGPYRTRLESMARELGVASNVVFLGRLTDDEKYFYYQKCDVFVMTSRVLPDGDVEGFGIVFLEANAFGKPVIGGRSGGMADAIMNGETGLLVEPDRPADIAKAIVQVLKDKSLANRMGETGRKRNIETMDWNLHAVRMIDNIHESIGKTEK